VIDLRVRWDPPLDPSGSEARDELRRELLKPEYHQQNLAQQIYDWIVRRIYDGLDAASEAPPLSTFAAMVLLVGLVALLVYLVSQARRTARTRSSSQPVLTDEVITAAELRARAEAALDAGDFAAALVDAYRALAVRQVERGRLMNTPGATADEVADDLAAEYPAVGDQVRASAQLFDAVLYGDRPATREQAVSVLGLDDELAVRR
jgi:hypothetical protein